MSINIIINEFLNELKEAGYNSIPSYEFKLKLNDTWAIFRFGSIQIELGGFNDSNDIYVVNVINWSGKRLSGFYDDSFYKKEGCFTTYETDFEGCKKAITSLVSLLLTNKMKLESGLGKEKMEVFSKHPEFFIRRKENKAFFFDSTTKKAFWQTTAAQKVAKEGNGYWYIKTQNTKYNLVFA